MYSSPPSVHPHGQHRPTKKTHPRKHVPRLVGCAVVHSNGAGHPFLPYFYARDLLLISFLQPSSAVTMLFLPAQASYHCPTMSSPMCVFASSHIDGLLLFQPHPVHLKFTFPQPPSSTICSSSYTPVSSWYPIHISMTLSFDLLLLFTLKLSTYNIHLVRTYPAMWNLMYLQLE